MRDFPIELAIFVFSSIVTVAVAWGVMKAMLGNMTRQMSEMFSWRNKYLEIWANHVVENTRDISEIRGALNVREEQYREIIRRLTIIESKMEERRRFSQDRRDEDNKDG